MHAILCPPISYACHAACIFTFFPDAISNESHNSGCAMMTYHGQPTTHLFLMKFAMSYCARYDVLCML